MGAMSTSSFASLAFSLRECEGEHALCQVVTVMLLGGF